MKKLYWLFAIIPIYGILVLLDIHPLRYKKNEFHVRVGCVGENLPFNDSRWAYDYPIYFTNNNWATETGIMSTFDCSTSWGGGNCVAHQEWTTSGDSTVAINFANKFKSYDQCLRYNDSVKTKYNILQKYRDLHEIPQKEEPKTDCCKTINIK